MSVSSDAGSSLNCKDFVSEAELEARRKRRQEEWEKVRKPDDPLEAPEEAYDPRSLYEQLQEQKDKKQAEYEESHRLKNLIKGLDDDEVAFLELVDKTKMDMEAKLLNEEMKEIQEFQKAVAHVSEEESEARLKELRKALRIPTQGPLKKSQQDMLSSAIKRKASNGVSAPEKKLCTRTESADEVKESNSGEKKSEDTIVSPVLNPSTVINIARRRNGALQCLGILPGLGAYSDSSDSDDSSNSEIEKDSDFELIGRKRICIKASKTKESPSSSELMAHSLTSW